MKIKNKVEFSFYDVKYSYTVEDGTISLLKLNNGEFILGHRYNNKWIDDSDGVDVTNDALEFSVYIKNK